MGCNELLQLLNTEGWEQGEDPLTCHGIVAHLRSCVVCSHGMVRLSSALLTPDMLSCEACRVHFPAYYEATRPDFPLTSLPDQEIAAIVLHLSKCPACNEEYEELVLLSELEERDELLDA
ncbi:MAG TPA: hypothetical protein VGN34_18045 [Ktedonobacteraceae bacterium]|jgi:hypothetical protein